MTYNVIYFSDFIPSYSLVSKPLGLTCVAYHILWVWVFVYLLGVMRNVAESIQTAQHFPPGLDRVC